MNIKRKRECIKKIIEENPQIAEMGQYNYDPKEEWIRKTEKRLNIKLPESYIWWVNHYNGGEINGYEVYSIYEEDINDDLPGGDIGYINEKDRKNGFVDNYQLVIQDNDQGETYYFDLKQQNEHGGFPIYVQFGEIKEKYAEDFYGFLEKKIKE